MSFRLQNLNVVRIVETEREARALVSKGFKHIAKSVNEEVAKFDDLFSDMNFSDLKAKAREEGLEFDRKVKKNDLIAMLKAKSQS